MRDLLGTSGEEGFGYARKVDVMTFMKSKNYEDNLRKAAQLAGARFVYSSEIDEEHRLNEQLIKDMTGGDTMEARRLYKEAFNFKPTFKPWMYGNHKPEIRGTDDALWGRVKLIEFPVSFADRVDLRCPKSCVLNCRAFSIGPLPGVWPGNGRGWRPRRKCRPPRRATARSKTPLANSSASVVRPAKTICNAKPRASTRPIERWAEASMGTPVLSQKRFGAYLTAHGYPSDDNADGHGAVPPAD